MLLRSWFKPSERAELDRIQNFGIPAETEKALMQMLSSDEPGVP